MTPEEKLKRLCSMIETIVPYVDATLQNRLPVKDQPDWLEVHKGRAFSSVSQLDNLLQVSREETDDH
jgi:hypothetical protein